ncbi:hypothetical protein [Hymenobacter koreensis]|uniref:DUF3953 domain-containing protein n=1 Tax=Hymenobacter koreensis TaxID=1084523 RepID=A0ABP8J0L9_9BACT
MEPHTKRVLGGNLLLLLVGAVLLRLFNSGSGEAGLGFLILMALFILMLLLINLCAAIATSQRGHRKDYLLGMLLVLLVGFGTCFATASSY